MAIRFRCPHCKKPLRVENHQAGKKVGCPACKKGILIPASAAAASAKAGVDPTRQQTASPEQSAAELEAIAAEALSEPTTTNGAPAQAEATIDFACEYCDAELHVPRSEAGKRMPCPNPECRRIIKVPSPKDGQLKALPTVAQLTQPEKIDEAAWGTQTDRSRAGRESLEEAGAVPPPKKEPIGARGWIRRGMWTVAAVAAAVVLVVAGARINTIRERKDIISELLSFVEPGRDVKPEALPRDPVLRAEIYRVIALYKVRAGNVEREKTLGDLQKALASVRVQAGSKAASVERDLFLSHLLLTITELGGTDDEVLDKVRYDWKERTIREELGRALEAIKAPEARVMAMRTLATRLLEKDHAALATGLATQLSHTEKGRRPPITSQQIVLLLLGNQPVDKIVSVPDMANLANEPPELLARVGFAEYHARKGAYDKAQELAFAKGEKLEQLEACVGVAQVILSKNKDATTDASPFVDKALEIAGADGKVKMPPWLLLQTVRVVARLKGPTAVPQSWLKQFPAEFKPRGHLELVLAEADASMAPLDINSLADIKTANPDSPSLDLGWEALARQNVRAGKKNVLAESMAAENVRFRPMAYTGAALGELDRR
jgi:hypothetical protein